MDVDELISQLNRLEERTGDLLAVCEGRMTQADYILKWGQ